MSKAHQILIPSSAYHEAIQSLLFAIDHKRIRWYGCRPGVSRPPRAEFAPYAPPYMLVLNYYTDGVCLCWDTPTSTAYPELAWTAVEGAVREHLTRLDSTETHDGITVRFRGDGAVDIGGIAISWGALSHIYWRARITQEQSDDG